MIALVVFTDGRREHLPWTVPSFDGYTTGPVSERYIVDDSGDPENHEWIRRVFPEFELVIHESGERQGFGGAIRTGWDHLRRHSTASHIFHLEDDFTFNRPVDLLDLAAVLSQRPNVAQVALRRQPWNEHEALAGGIVEQHPDAYTDHEDGHGRAWLEHRQFFTTNPTLYRRSLIEENEWPEGRDSEGRFSIALLGDEDLRFAFYGRRDSGEWVQHNGNTRNGTGY